MTIQAQPIKDWYNLPESKIKKPFIPTFADHLKSNWHVLLMDFGAGVFRRINDDITNKFDQTVFANGRNHHRKDPRISWMNKCKKHPNPDIQCVPKFLGATTFLAWTTDLWHGSKAGEVTLLRIGGTTYKKSGNFGIDAGFTILRIIAYGLGATATGPVIKKPIP